MKLSPALAYLAANPWAMEFGLFGRLSDVLANHAAGDRADAETVAAIKAAAGNSDGAPAEPAMSWDGQTAIIPMRGALARYASSVNGFCQPQGRSAEAVQTDLLAAADRGAKRIILRIDSPGGEVSGIAETAQLVRQISAGGIPVTAFVDGTAASAAYWIASQADEIIASAPTAQVGSIGVAMSINGGSGRQTIITSAPAKAGANQDAALANARAMVVDLATAFADAVAAGRGLTAQQAAALATGEMWTAQTALGLGLVDRIASWQQVLAGDVAAPDGDQPAPARRAAIAAAIAATVTVRQPAAASAETTNPPAEATASTSQPQPASPVNEGTSMDPKVQAKLAALCQQHPTHSAALVAEATKAGATEATVQAACDALVIKAKDEAHAAEVADLKAKLAAANEKAETEAKARKDAEAKAAHAQPTDPGLGNPAEGLHRMKMSDDAKAAFIAKNGQDAYFKLPV